MCCIDGQENKYLIMSVFKQRESINISFERTERYFSRGGVTEVTRMRLFGHPLPVPCSSISHKFSFVENDSDSCMGPLIEQRIFVQVTVTLAAVVSARGTIVNDPRRMRYWPLKREKGQNLDEVRAEQFANWACISSYRRSHVWRHGADFLG
jgi:hypothetical protein